MALAPKDIEEVKIAFRATGNLKKDVKALSRPRKIDELNNELSFSMRFPPNEVLPTNQIPSALKMRKPNEGQVPLLGVSSDGKMTGILGLVASAIIKDKPSPQPLTVYETEKFYSKIKFSIDMEYFTNAGLDEYAFDRYLIYADKNFSLTKTYARNFNLPAIEKILKDGLRDYLKTSKS